jgi:hypothetical protein
MVSVKRKSPGSPLKNKKRNLVAASAGAGFLSGVLASTLGTSLYNKYKLQKEQSEIQSELQSQTNETESLFDQLIKSKKIISILEQKISEIQKEQQNTSVIKELNHQLQKCNEGYILLQKNFQKCENYGKEVTDLLSKCGNDNKYYHSELLKCVEREKICNETLNLCKKSNKNPEIESLKMEISTLLSRNNQLKKELDSILHNS